MIETIRTTVITPTLTPRMVSDERTLLERSVSMAIHADSLTSSNRIIRTLDRAGMPQHHPLAGGHVEVKRRHSKPRINADETDNKHTAGNISDPRKSAFICGSLSALPCHLSRYSLRSASIGSSRAARHAGQSPKITPTIEETPTPSTADHALMSKGKPIASASRYASPNPVNTPIAPPIAV